MRIRLDVCALVVVALSAGRLPAQHPAAGSAIRYDRDVRPILADRCFACHGPDAAAREAELRLDERGDAVRERDGAFAIVPGDVDGSELWRRITTDAAEDRMPPPDSGKKALTADEIAVLRAWIEQGAAYEPHWSFVPPVRPPLPPVRDAAWCRTPIDHFVLAELERHGVAPGPEADRATLVRRAFLLLTGLPPSPEELRAAVADPAPDAYERLVQRLLHDEPWRSRGAEHLAATWLDAARYADTCGIHTDAGRQIWPWRDWVLHALRAGMPFDQFVTEQLAGDLLPDATVAQRTATGFLRNHVTTDEGGAIPEEYLVEYAVDRTATTGAVMLGLTLGCARCHEHKYDPIAHDDFYRLLAFFDQNDEPGLYSQEKDPRRAFEPALEVPTPEQSARRDELVAAVAAARVGLEATDPDEAEAFAAFAAAAARHATWAGAEVVDARSARADGADLQVQPDGSVLATGANPVHDAHVVTLRTDATDLRLLAVEALTDPSLPHGKVGRAGNGNAVLMAVTAEVASRVEPGERRAVPFTWAWADVAQTDGDYAATNVLSVADGAGWAVAAHQRDAGPRTLLLLAAAPFGFVGGSEIVVTLHYDSIYAQHVLGRVRLDVASVTAAGLARLPETASMFHVAGPFVAAAADLYSASFGPESATGLDRAQRFGDLGWRLLDGVDEGAVQALPEGSNASFVAWQLFAPTARRRPLSLGSDDGFVLFHDGVEVARRAIDRGVAADQDRVEVDLHAGANLIVQKVVNTGGAAGFALRRLATADELGGDLVAALLPERARHPELARRLRSAWRQLHSPVHAARQGELAAREAELAALVAAIPRTMVMQERAERRPTYVLLRGAYDQPDRARPVTPGVPPALGALPAGAPADRRGLAAWLCAPDHPLFARVQANRFWELLFGAGLVRTSEDFGMQGEWPSHPELLDWLAVEFRENGWDVRALLARIATSAVFRQSSRARPDVRERDPDNRWLASFPRRRLPAEVIRDQALAVAGLLVERFGGPSVKPYQPDGLWQEVAMPASNTRFYERGAGYELYRRSLYTYWKRACPPPNLAAFDAPTRESCTIRRGVTNTPLQALVLWNDVQFVEAARALAARTLRDPDLTADEARLAALFVRCTGDAPDAAAVHALAQALADLRARYLAAPGDAAALLAVGDHPVAADVAAPELAAWTLLANAVLQLDATLCID
ncbi:MAG: PSD1 domain-containing protein [Planctomycetes bacterium]|nr:PSD1 domain-containing protein [Planctomycetota bacterium]